jgi:4-amino-4-deoxy-L-arabinose transferase-like glycosyltransferase
MEVSERPEVSKRFLLPLVLVNLVLRSLWIVYMHPPQKADFEWYFTHAVQLAEQNMYVWNGHATAYWPIGWPFFLSLFIRVFGPHVMVGLFVNAVLSTVIVVLVYLLTLYVFQSRLAAAIASIAYTVLPSQILWNSILGSEELFTVLLMLSTYLYIRATSVSHKGWLRLTILSGLAIGFASDVRPIALLFPVVVLLYEWVIQGRRWMEGFWRTVTYGVSMVVGILPVTIRNILSLHHFVLVSTNGGVNLWQGTKTDGGYYWSWLPWQNPLLAAGNNEIKEDQIGKQVAVQHILAHPKSTLYHGFLKIVSLYKDDVNSVWYTFRIVNNALTPTVNMICTSAYWLFMLLAIVGLVICFTRRIAWKLALFPVLWIVYNTLLFVFFPAWDRFRYPMMPMFAMFLGFGIAWMVQRRRSQGTEAEA